MKTSPRLSHGRELRFTLVFGVVISVLAGCQPQPVKPDPKLEYRLEQERIAREQAAKQRRIDALLMRAEWALGRDRLMTPESDSAYGLFQRVLRLEPDNQQARSGLQQVSIRYIQLARDSVAHDKLARASGYYAQARRIDPDNPLLAEFEQMYRAAQQAQRRATSGNEIMLDPTSLSRRDEQLLEVLGSVAQRVKVSDESLMIVARNDAEGRWLYQQMRKAAEGYRIRGDIQIGAVPKIVVYPPIQ